MHRRVHANVAHWPASRHPPRRLAMRLEYLPLLRRSLTAPLQPTADNNSGKDGIATVMELMNAYGFTKYVYDSPSPARAPPPSTACSSCVCLCARRYEQVGVPVGARSVRCSRS
jgi:hypothetical protein